jgi:hypothetical protein
MVAFVCTFWTNEQRATMYMWIQGPNWRQTPLVNSCHHLSGEPANQEQALERIFSTPGQSNFVCAKIYASREIYDLKNSLWLGINFYYVLCLFTSFRKCPHGHMLVHFGTPHPSPEKTLLMFCSCLQNTPCCVSGEVGVTGWHFRPGHSWGSRLCGRGKNHMRLFL